LGGDSEVFLRGFKVSIYTICNPGGLTISIVLIGGFVKYFIKKVVDKTAIHAYNIKHD